jgi:hypothetical protein
MARRRTFADHVARLAMDWSCRRSPRLGLAFVTFGIGFLLAPVSFGLSVVALRRFPRPRGPLPWLGLVANVALLIIGSYIGVLVILGLLD